MDICLAEHDGQVQIIKLLPDSLKQLLDHMIKMGLSSENRQQGIYFADDMEDIKALLATVTK